MRPILLIATNFAREQRLTLVVLLGWLLVFAFMYSFWNPKEHEDLVFFFRQFTAYAIVLNILVSAQGFYNDRKTRRMIAVLSKGITRAQYLVGHSLGCALFSGAYLLAFAAVQSWFSIYFGIEMRMAETIFAVWIASVLAAVMALVFACFLPPLLVSIATALVIVLPAVYVAVQPGDWSVLWPVSHVSRHLLHYQYGGGWTGGWTYIPVTVAQSAVLWLLASGVFHRQDVTAAVE